MKALFIAAVVVAGALMVRLAPARASRPARPQPAVVQPAPAVADDPTPPAALGPGLAESAYAAAPLASR